MISTLLLLLLKKIGNARPGEGECHPISPIATLSGAKVYRCATKGPRVPGLARNAQVERHKVGASDYT